jgi:hypothetical protein
MVLALVIGVGGFLLLWLVIVTAILNSMGCLNAC